MIDGLVMLILCLIAVLSSYAAGYCAGWRRQGGNFRPLDNPHFDEHGAINEPPPWPLGGQVGQKPAVRVIHVYEGRPE